MHNGHKKLRWMIINFGCWSRQELFALVHLVLLYFRFGNDLLAWPLRASPQGSVWFVTVFSTRGHFACRRNSSWKIEKSKNRKKKAFIPLIISILHFKPLFSLYTFSFAKEFVEKKTIFLEIKIWQQTPIFSKIKLLKN